MFFRRQESSPPINWSLRLIAIIIVTAFGSTFLGIWLQQTALKFSPVGIAQTLTATSPLFVLPIAAMMGDRINWEHLTYAMSINTYSRQKLENLQLDHKEK
jgi:drug/metabolite transporter (DMT)-like permease